MAEPVPPASGRVLPTDTVLDLRGLKCPLPVLRTRKALLAARPGERLAVQATDPLAGLDLGNLARETGDALEGVVAAADHSVFLIRRAVPCA